MVKCVALHWGDAEASAAGGCEQNPFLTPYPYLFITISLALACGARPHPASSTIQQLAPLPLS